MVFARTSALFGPPMTSAALKRICALSWTGFRSHSFLAATDARMALLISSWISHVQEKRRGQQIRQIKYIFLSQETQHNRSKVVQNKKIILNRFKGQRNRIKDVEEFLKTAGGSHDPILKTWFLHRYIAHFGSFTCCLSSKTSTQQRLLWRVK